MAETILDRFGRVELARIVASFYSDVLRSPRLRPYFDNISIAALSEHQAQFLAAVMGGPSAYPAYQIRRAHSHLGITEEDFEEMLRLLESNLLAFGMDADDAKQVVAGYREMQPAVVDLTDPSGTDG
jgi:hemoglobin